MGDTINYTEDFDAALKEMRFYKQYKEYLPFVGSQYKESPVKILILGESHYLPDKSKALKGAEEWYQGNSGKLEEEDKEYIRTRVVVKSGKKKHVIFRNLEAALIKADLPKCSNVFNYVAYMNSFQRPAVCKKSISEKQENIDVTVAVEVINGVVEIIKPDLILFVSKWAGNILSKKINLEPEVKVYVFPHPSRPCWFRKTKKNGVGRDRFVARVKEAWHSTPTSPT